MRRQRARSSFRLTDNAVIAGACFLPTVARKLLQATTSEASWLGVKVYDVHDRCEDNAEKN